MQLSSPAAGAEGARTAAATSQRYTYGADSVRPQPSAVWAVDQQGPRVPQIVAPKPPPTATVLPRQRRDPLQKSPHILAGGSKGPFALGRGRVPSHSRAPPRRGPARPRAVGRSRTRRPALPSGPPPCQGTARAGPQGRGARFCRLAVGGDVRRIAQRPRRYIISNYQDVSPDCELLPA